MRFRSLLSIAHVTVVEQFRNRLYLVVFLFAPAVMLASLLLGALAPNQKIRVIFDFGLLMLELFGLGTAVFGAVGLILQEMESKTIYLILTRPLPRWVYLLGRYVGLMAAVILTLVVMAAFHVLVMVLDTQWFRTFSDSFPFWSTYPALVFMSILKIILTGSIAFFFSLFATSQVSALVFTGCVWVSGHFGMELKFMIDKLAVSGPGWVLVKMLSGLLPNFQYLNYRDLFLTPGFSGYLFMGWACLYVAGYTLFWLFLSVFLFSRKEF